MKKVLYPLGRLPGIFEVSSALYHLFLFHPSFKPINRCHLWSQEFLARSKEPQPSLKHSVVRHEVQLLTPTRIVGKTNGRDNIPRYLKFVHHTNQASSQFNMKRSENCSVTFFSLTLVLYSRLILRKEGVYISMQNLLLVSCRIEQHERCICWSDCSSLVHVHNAKHFLNYISRPFVEVVHF